MALALALIMCLSLLPVSVSAANEFHIENDILIEYNGSGGNVTIPYGVVDIGDWAFHNCSALTSVTIPEGVLTIGDYAFYGCGSLTNISIPSSVWSVGAHAFAGTGLTGIAIPDSVQNIGSSAFSFCSNLENVTLPKDLKTIKSMTFSGCGNLTSVSIPNGVQAIGTQAFSGCDKLSVITVPSSVKEISNYAIGYSLDKTGDRFAPYMYGQVTIRGQAGSAAEVYAKENRIKFKIDAQPGSAVCGFLDVRAGDWFEDSVRFVVEMGMFKGTSEFTFSPGDAMTRAMFFVVLARWDGADTAGGTVWYEKAVQWAIEKGLYDGRDPEGAVTRQEIAVILHRYKNLYEGVPEVSGNLDRFPDASSVSEYAREAMLWAVNSGYINGIDGRLAPTETATRAQVATIFMRAFEFVG